MSPSLQILPHEPSEPASSVAQGDALCHTSRVQTLADLRHWIDCLSEGQQRETPVHRLRQTLAVLELGASRDSRKQLQGVLKSWGIKQKDSSSKKKLLGSFYIFSVIALLKLLSKYSFVFFSFILTIKSEFKRKK